MNEKSESDSIPDCVYWTPLTDIDSTECFPRQFLMVANESLEVHLAIQ